MKGTKAHSRVWACFKSLGDEIRETAQSIRAGLSQLMDGARWKSHDRERPRCTLPGGTPPHPLTTTRGHPRASWLCPQEPGGPLGRFGLCPMVHRKHQIEERASSLGLSRGSEHVSCVTLCESPGLYEGHLIFSIHLGALPRCWAQGTQAAGRIPVLCSSLVTSLTTCIAFISSLFWRLKSESSSPGL